MIVAAVTEVIVFIELKVVLFELWLCTSSNHYLLLVRLPLLGEKKLVTAPLSCVVMLRPSVLELFLLPIAVSAGELVETVLGSTARLCFLLIHRTSFARRIVHRVEQKVN